MRRLAVCNKKSENSRENGGRRMKKALAIGLAAVMAVSMSAPVFASDDSESGAGIAKEDLK